MTPNYAAQIIDMADGKGVCIPDEYLELLATTNVILEWREEGILIRPVVKQEPPKDWETLFAQTDSPSADFIDWDDELKEQLDKE
jgi:hypothetical protein